MDTPSWCNIVIQPEKEKYQKGKKLTVIVNLQSPSITINSVKQTQRQGKDAKDDEIDVDVFWADQLEIYLWVILRHETKGELHCNKLPFRPGNIKANQNKIEIECYDWEILRRIRKQRNGERSPRPEGWRYYVKAQYGSSTAYSKPFIVFSKKSEDASLQGLVSDGTIQLKHAILLPKKYETNHTIEEEHNQCDDYCLGESTLHLKYPKASEHKPCMCESTNEKFVFLSREGAWTNEDNAVLKIDIERATVIQLSDVPICVSLGGREEETSKEKEREPTFISRIFRSPLKLGLGRVDGAVIDVILRHKVIEVKIGGQIVERNKVVRLGRGQSNIPRDQTISKDHLELSIRSNKFLLLTHLSSINATYVFPVDKELRLYCSSDAKHPEMEYRLYIGDLEHYVDISFTSQTLQSDKRPATDTLPGHRDKRPRVEDGRETNNNYLPSVLNASDAITNSTPVIQQLDPSGIRISHHGPSALPNSSDVSLPPLALQHLRSAQPATGPFLDNEPHYNNVGSMHGGHMNGHLNHLSSTPQTSGYMAHAQGAQNSYAPLSPSPVPLSPNAFTQSYRSSYSNIVLSSMGAYDTTTTSFNSPSHMYSASSNPGNGSHMQGGSLESLEGLDLIWK